MARLYETAILELKQNTRLRLGVWGILLILLFYSYLLRSDSLESKVEEYRTVEQRLISADRVVSAEDWPALLKEDKERFSVLERGLWQAETVGIAQASFQASIREMLEGLTISRLRIRPAVAKEIQGQGIWLVQMEVNGRYRRGDELQLLYRVARHSPRIHIEHLVVNGDVASIRMVMSIRVAGIQQTDVAT